MAAIDNGSSGPKVVFQIFWWQVSHLPIPLMRRRETDGWCFLCTPFAELNTAVLASYSYYCCNVHIHILIWMLYIICQKQAVWGWEATLLFGWFIFRIYSCLTVVSRERLLDPSICIQSGHLHFHSSSRSPQRFQAELKHGFPKTLGPFALVKCKLLSLWIDRVPWSTRLGWVWWRFRGCCLTVFERRCR